MGVGNDLRYTPTTCFETFPLPWPPGEEPEGDSRIEAIAAAARRLDELRRNRLNPEGGFRSGAKEAHSHEFVQPAPDVARERARLARRGRLRGLRLAARYL
jgi:hypothetical protein